MAFSLSGLNIRSILLDIEGTTTPISFVYDVLFPFAREKAKAYLTERFNSEEVQADLSKLSEEQATDIAQAHMPLVDQPASARIDSIAKYVYWLMDRDRKSTGLKSLQGKIWQQGYHSGLLKAQVFEDVPPALERWHEANLKVAIFSSGSVLAQKLLFAHTELGDLTRFINSYFDTTSGPKTAAESYGRIARQLDVSPARILFISDVTKELDAASLAGMHTLLCLRPGNHPQPPDSQHRAIKGFDEIKE